MTEYELFMMRMVPHVGRVLCALLGERHPLGRF